MIKITITIIIIIVIITFFSNLLFFSAQVCNPLGGCADLKLGSADLGKPWTSRLHTQTSGSGPNAWGPQPNNAPTKSELTILSRIIFSMPNEKDNLTPPLHALQVYVARTTVTLNCSNPQ
jgi:hypothetical protein